jgi:hypothetical protein
VYDAGKACGKHLIVRPFSAIRADYEKTRRAILSLPEDIEVMLKSDPFDWDPFLPINPALATYPASRLTVEFDLGNEYYGDNQLPLLYPDYLRERLDRLRRLGITRAVGRIDHAPPMFHDTEQRINVAFFCDYARDDTLDPRTYVAHALGEQYGLAAPDEAAGLLMEAWAAYKKMFYIDGNLFFHTPMGGLEHAIRCMAFELVRPGQSLAHCADEWHVLSDRTTLAAAAVRAEKDEAVAMAERIHERLAELAADTPLVTRAESLVLMARLYRATVLAFQAYVLEVLAPAGGEAAFSAAVAGLRDAADALKTAGDAQWFARVAGRARTLAGELQQAFTLERAFHRDMPGLTDPEKARVEDLVAVGYPGEGHRISKHTHGSTAGMDADRCWRSVGLSVQYTLAASPGHKTLHVLAAGTGRLRVAEGNRLLAECEWQHGTRWQPVALDLDSPGNSLSVRIEHFAQPKPQVAALYLLRSDPAGRQPKGEA